MKLVRASLLAISFAAACIGIGYAHFGVAGAAVNESQTPAACARCGDGQCQKSCGENSTTCPKDCGGGPGVPS